MRLQLIGDTFEGPNKWRGCAIGNDGFLYSVPYQTNRNRILRIDTTDDSTSLIDLGLRKTRVPQWTECLNGPDGCIYGIPCKAQRILKYNPSTQEVTRVGKNISRYRFATVGLNGKIYSIPADGKKKILRYDPENESISFVGRYMVRDGFVGAVLAGDGCIYTIPNHATRVLRFDPNDEDSAKYIGKSYRYHCAHQWSGAVLGADGNVYGIPYNFNRILKIDVTNRKTTLVGPDLGEAEAKYNSGVLGYDQCIYMIPKTAEFVLRFNPITGVTSTVGESLGNGEDKYLEGALAPNGYIYAPPFNAGQVLKIRAWGNWLYLKHRLLTEQRRAVRKIVQFDDDLNIVQHFIIHTNDDIFRTVLEMV